MLASYRLDSRLRGNDGIYGFRPKVLYHKSLLCDFRVSFVVKKANHKEHKGLTKYTKSEKVWVLFLWAEALCLVSLDSRLRGNDEKRYIIFWQKPHVGKLLLSPIYLPGVPPHPDGSVTVGRPTDPVLPHFRHSIDCPGIADIPLHAGQVVS